MEMRRYPAYLDEPEVRRAGNIPRSSFVPNQLDLLHPVAR